VVSNHITYTDVGFILAALPVRLRHRLAVAIEGEILASMWRPPAELSLLARWLNRAKYVLVVSLFNVFPLPQRSGFRDSFFFAGDAVDRGWNVLVFPEGARTRDGKMAPFRGGIGLLAARLGIPVVPARIDGLFELKRAGKRMTRPFKVTVTIGAPVRFDRGDDPELIARELERRVVSLSELSEKGSNLKA
jgi:long-chain acyl-CoA synthetase